MGQRGSCAPHKPEPEVTERVLGSLRETLQAHVVYCFMLTQLCDYTLLCLDGHFK